MGRTPKDKELADRQKLALLLGLEISDDEIKESAEAAKEYHRENNSREAEAVLLYVGDRRKFTQKECKNCSFVFAVNRKNVAYCSDECRRRALEKIGIIWDSSKNSEERWDFKEPLTIPPQVLVQLQHHLEILEQDTQVEAELLPETVPEVAELQELQELDIPEVSDLDEILSQL